MEAPAHADSNNALERFFKFKQWNTSLKRDTLAGLTTFIVMSYIIFVNPSILGLEGKGLPSAAVLTSTCLVAGVMTIIMGLFTNRAYAIAPGMGLNAVVAFSLVLGQGLSFESAMGLIFLEGVAITILVLTGFREAIFKDIPLELKKAIVVGIGFFILFIGLVNGGLVVGGGGTPLSLGTYVGVPPPPTTRPPLTRPMNRMKKPMPTTMAFFSSSGMALKMASRKPVSTRIVMATPSRKMRPMALSKLSP